jgi:hypothetical protein
MTTAMRSLHEMPKPVLHPIEDRALELQQAYARIAELERDLDGRPVATSQRASAALKSFFFLLGLAIIVIVSSIAIGRATRHVPVAAVGEAPREPMPVAGALQLARVDQHGPALVDLDADGKRDLVMLGWRAGNPDAPLYVVAIDRATYEVRWRNGPHRSAYRDKRVRATTGEPGEVVLVDALGKAHVIDARSGTTKVTRDASSLPDDSKSPCPADRSRPCVQRADMEKVKLALPPKLRAGLTPWSTEMESDGDRVSFVEEVAKGQAIKHAVALDGAAHLRWTSPLVPRTQTERPTSSVTPNDWTALANGRLVHVYQSIAGPYRMSAHETRGGTLAYDVALPLEYGSIVDGLIADGDDVFLVSKGSLFVLEGRTGAVARRIARF